MAYEEVGKLIDKWINDQEFRTQLRANPETAIKNTGVSLSQEELAAVMKIDWSQNDQELQSLISKSIPGV